jgi:ferritin-like metal-binding protein YciE
MEETNLAYHFKRLRMIYCREQQLIGFLPDLVSEAMQPGLKEALAGSLAAARCRRYMVNDLAWGHGIPPLGEECLAMRKLIAVGSARLAAECRGERHDQAVEAFCLQLHRVVMVEYELARSLAVEKGLHADVGCFTEMIEAMTDAWGRIKKQPKFSRQLALSSTLASR